MLRIKVSFNGLNRMKKVSKNKLKRVLMKSMFKMQEIAIRKAPVDLGDLRQKIDLFPEVLSDNYVLKSKAPYSAAMEFGTRPFYAPIKPLKEWAGRKLGDEKLGYAVKNKIAKYGITAHPYMRPALFEVKNYWLPLYLKQNE